MENQSRDVGYNHLSDNSGQAQLVREGNPDQGTYTTNILGTESYRLEKDTSARTLPCKGMPLTADDNLHPIKFDDYMSQPYKSCDQTIDCPQQARYNTSGLDSDYIRQKKDDDYNPSILQQAGKGASNMAHDAANAVKNTLGMNRDNTTSATPATIPTNPK